ncbi:N-acetylmuramoyl-L-alanine amidase family protein [Clostridium chromiireducens]|uniref:N-acetylmuramoyl-L-alanine amidase family protein n=1 Tax=Clostridium chromiireducens TaxID=225345 RepID=A0A964W0Z2_9CLOT|nr:N-acetylmuramoyl-L-alanine amidase family protein [Clostridium chromiireducens]MVX62886.1 N-acetylmuramoyl-L-alanine amidase family protein [Clostridium chromiireducens]
MFKRANKITALLVAAASVMSIVPAMAADSSRLGTKDGTITNAIAYKDGKYAYRGYRTDDDSEGIYYNAGDKDKALEDVEDADLMGAFDNKYAFANDGSDQYLVDLSNGQVTDEATPEDQADTASTKLKTALKKTDRYGSSVTVTASNLGYTDKDNTGALPGPKFSETWYAYAVAGNGQDNAVGGQLFGFTNATGKYIDASNLANVYAYSSYKGKNVKIEEYNDLDSDTKLEVKLLQQPQVLTQDKDYIYAVVKVAITDSNTAAHTGAGVTTSAAVGTVNATTTIHYYLQKISKAQGDKKDDAFLPKSVDSYEIDNKSYLNNGDVNDAYTAILLPDDTYQPANNQYAVKDNTLYVTRVKTDKVKVFALKLTKIKENTMNGISSDKVDAYVVKKTGDSDQDLPGTGLSNDGTAVSIDVDGNTWAINEGKIYKFTGTDKKVVFTCDRSLDKLSVYDDGSLIAWDGTNDGDVYTTVQEGKAETDAEAPAATPAKVGWDKLADGTWNFYDATGTKVVNNWANVGGVWYFLKADGVMATGWLNQNGTWYYLNASGAMATGWLNDNGTWYYLNASGAMLANTTVDGYVLGASGAWVK